MNELPEHIKALIAYVDTNMPLDGPYKVAVLNTVASYYESITKAESMEVILAKAFNSMN